MSVMSEHDTIVQMPFNLPQISFTREVSFQYSWAFHKPESDVSEDWSGLAVVSSNCCYIRAVTPPEVMRQM